MMMEKHSAVEWSESRIRVFTFGEFLVEVNSQPLRFQGRAHRKPLDFLKLLIALGGENVPSGRIRDLIWPDSDEDRAIISFNTTLSRLRKLIGREAIINQNDSLSLNRNVCWVDSKAFSDILMEKLPEQGNDLTDQQWLEREKAISIYQGPFLAGFSGFTDVSLARQKFHRIFLSYLNLLASHLKKSGDIQNLVALYKKGISTDPGNEGLYRKLMICQEESGLVEEALDTFRLCREALLEEYGISPSPDTRKIAVRLEQGIEAGGVAPREVANAASAVQPSGGLAETVRREVVLANFSVSGLDFTQGGKYLEEAESLMTAVEIELSRMVSTFGGVVNKAARNEITVLFHCSSVLWKSMEKTVEMLFFSWEELITIIHDLAPLYSDRLGTKLVITTGSVMMVPGVGCEELYQLIGNPQSRNARLTALANPGMVLVSNALYQQIREYQNFRFEPVSSSDPDAMGDQIEAYRVFYEANFFRTRVRNPPLPLNVEDSLSLPDQASIAVLAFENLTDDPENSYFGSGLAEDIITDLSKISELFVIARESSFQYQGEYTSVKQIGREMGVAYVLEGSVRKISEGIRLTVNLVDAIEGKRVWSDRYDCDLSKIHEVQEEITTSIVTELDVKLVTGPQASYLRPSFSRPEARDLYYRGRQLFFRMTRQDNQEALQVFHRAVELDPDSSLGYIGVSASQWLNAHYGWAEDRVIAARQSAEYALKAMERDPGNPYCYSNLSLLSMLKRDFEEAFRLIGRAMELGPGMADAIAAKMALEHFACEWEKSIETGSYYMRLSPISPAWVHATIGDSLYFLQRYQEAIRFCRKAAALYPNYAPPWFTMGLCYSALGESEKALVACQSYYAFEKVFPPLKVTPGAYPYRDPGVIDTMLKDLDRIGLVENPEKAMV